MADDMKDRAPQDAQRINVNQDHEVRYWTDALGVTEEQLRRAVEQAGVMAADVRAHLGKR